MVRRPPLRSLILLFAFLVSTGFALPGHPKDDWPPISPEELALKDNSASPGAPAIILYREANTDDVQRFESQYYRIKILTDKGRKYADVEIPYIEKRLQVEDIYARTVHPDGTSVDFQGQVFDKVLIKAKKLKFHAKTFTLPSVQSGSIIEYSYKIRWHEKLPDVVQHSEQYIITGTDSIRLRQAFVSWSSVEFKASNHLSP